MSGVTVPSAMGAGGDTVLSTAEGMRPVICCQPSYGDGHQGLWTHEDGQCPFLLNHTWLPLLFQAAQTRTMKPQDGGDLGVLSLCSVHTSDRFMHFKLNDHWTDHSLKSPHWNYFRFDISHLRNSEKKIKT